jgi:peptidoglycan hydrolase-like protein with peptidoglycan-binding domain
MRIALLGLPLVLALASCEVTDSNQSQQHRQGQKEQQSQLAPNRGPASPAPDPLASRDPPVGQAAATSDIADPEARPVMQAQVVLDRLGFTPGVVDGKGGLSTRNAVSGFQEANHLTVTGKIDDATRQALAKWNNITVAGSEENRKGTTGTHPQDISRT